jgi:hypothetical protein
MGRREPEIEEHYYCFYFLIQLFWVSSGGRCHGIYIDMMSLEEIGLKKQKKTPTHR